MYEQRDPKKELLNGLKLALISIGLILGGGLMFVLATATGRVYPVVALFAGGMALFGALGLMIVLVMTPFWLVRLRSERDRPSPPESDRLASRPATTGFQPNPVSPVPYDQQRAAWEAAQRQPAAPSPVTPPPSSQPPPAHQAAPLRQPPMPQRELPPEQPAQRVPFGERPPDSATPPDERPTVVPRPAASRPYRDWTTDSLLERRQGIDGAAMGFAFQNLEIPQELTDELNAINAELARRSAG
jgi:hypothetical protein